MCKIIIKENHLYGIMNQQGEIIMEPIYDGIKKFANGFAAVCKDDKWGYIDEDCKLIIDFLYDDANDFSENGIAPVKLNRQVNSWRLLKDNGELIKMQNSSGYYYISEFNTNGYAIARASELYCIIDKNGNYINDKFYYSLKYLENQEIFLANKVGELCIINPLGEVVVDPCDDYDMIYFPSNGMCQVQKGNKGGYINLEGELVIPLKYKLVYEFADNGLAYVECESGLGGYINKLDEFIIKPSFESGTAFKHGFAAVSQNDKYFYIYKCGSKAINADFKYAGGFSECGLAKVETFDGKIQFIRPDGSVAVTIKDGADVDEFIGDKKISPIRIKGKVGLINNLGVLVIQHIYDDIIISAYGHLHRFYKDGLWGYIDNEGNEVIDNMYIEASEFTEGYMALVKFYSPTDNKEINMYINDRNQMIDSRLVKSFDKSFDNDYRYVYEFFQRLALAIKKEETTILNSCGEEIESEGFDLLVKDDNTIELEQEFSIKPTLRRR